MRVIVQRVLKAKCFVDKEIVGSCDKGLMLLISFTHTDDIEKVKIACKKIVNLRIFDDENDKMNLSLLDVKGSILAISQFTLYADTRKGNRPSFVDSMKPDDARILYQEMINYFKSEYKINVGEGIFGAHMYLEPICDGPVTIALEF